MDNPPKSANDLKIYEKHICQSAEEFMEKISPNGSIFGKYDLLGKDYWIFRGHESSDYKMEPTAYREGIEVLFRRKGHKSKWVILRPVKARRTEPITVEKQIQAEFYTIKAFFRLADEQGLPLPEDSQRLREMLKSFDDLKYILKLEAEKEQVKLEEAWKKYFNNNERKVNEVKEMVFPIPPASKWPPKEIRSLIALAQHYGLPTRLLDWTFDPLTAAWFAARGPVRGQKRSKKKCIDIWALHKSKLLGGYDDSYVKDYMDVGKLYKAAHAVDSDDYIDQEKRRYSLKVISAPSADNPNLNAQTGLFTMIRSLYGNWADEFKADEQRVDNLLSGEGKLICGKTMPRNSPKGRILLRFQLPYSQARNLFTMLARKGITKARHFPGYDGVAKTLLEDYKYWKDM